MTSQPCCSAAKELAEAVGIIRALYDHDFLNTCQHEETHRGGTIWEICNECGFKWADDKGGKPEWVDPPEWTAAKEFLTRFSEPEPDDPLLIEAREIAAAVMEGWIDPDAKARADSYREGVNDDKPEIAVIMDALRTRELATITEGEAK